MAILPHTVEVPGGQPVVIYAEPANINYFINGSLEPDTADDVTSGQVAVKAHTRAQYPGDPTPMNVSGASREFLVDPTRKSGNGLPGKSFVLAAYNEDGVMTEKRQFTYKGRWIDLHAFLSAEVTFQTFAFNNTGARYSLAATAAP
jgi:hypothetical protein